VTITDEAVQAAKKAVENTMLAHDYTASPTDFETDLRTALEAAFPHVFFAPNGDNHHNAFLCPYCTPRDRVTLQLEPARARRLIEVLRSAGAHPSGLGSYPAANDANMLADDIEAMVT
jgi:hypothetical protein